MSISVSLDMDPRLERERARKKAMKQIDNIWQGFDDIYKEFERTLDDVFKTATFHRDVPSETKNTTGPTPDPRQNPLKDSIRPEHYKKSKSGVECIEVVRHMNFNRGNAMKYIWRAGHKGNEIEDLKKAAYYINDEIERLNAIKPV